MAKVAKKAGGFEVTSRGALPAEERIRIAEAATEAAKEDAREAARKVYDMNTRLGYTETASDRIQELEERIQSQRTAEWNQRSEISRLLAVNSDLAEQVGALRSRVEELELIGPSEDDEEDDERTCGEVARDLAAVCLRALERKVAG